MLLCRVFAAFHQTIEFELFQIVALWPLEWVHTWVLDRWEVYIVFLFAVGELDFGGFELALRALRHLLLAEGNASLLTHLLVQLYHVLLSIIAVGAGVTVLVNEDLPPERVLVDIDALLGLEERLAGELLLSSLLTTSHDASTLLLDACDQTFEPGHKVFPVVLSDGATDFVTSRMVR